MMSNQFLSRTNIDLQIKMSPESRRSVFHLIARRGPVRGPLPLPGEVIHAAALTVALLIIDILDNKEENSILNKVM